MTQGTRRRITATLAAAAALTAVLVAPRTAVAAPDAAATEGGSIACTGTSYITYSPGLTLVPRTVTMDQSDLFYPCTSTTAPDITAGSGSFHGPLELSCVSPLPVGQADYTIHWNDGSTSTLALTFTMTVVGGQVISTIQGYVVAGSFAGSTVLGEWTYVEPAVLHCLIGNGITEQLGAIVLTIVGA